ncbi:MAG TPA: hypothetical protein VLB44_03045 [Kofleriaceae bacterium]|nr:hypothetical protein [Kofleriaceae bacterium]
MRYAASLVPCPTCGAPAPTKLDFYGDPRMWSLAGRCPSCNEPRNFNFYSDGDPLKLPMSPRHQLGGPEPSRVIRPSQFLGVLEKLEPELQTEPSQIPVATWAAQSATTDRAVTAAIELCKFLRPGDDAIDERFLTDEDRAFRRAQPERYTRAWLEKQRDRLVARANRFKADAPRVWMMRTGNKLHVSEEIRGVLNQITEQHVPTVDELRAYFAVRGEVRGDTVTLSEAGDVASIRAWQEPSRLVAQLAIRRATVADVEEATGPTQPAANGHRVAKNTFFDHPVTFELDVRDDRVEQVTLSVPTQPA